MSTLHLQLCLLSYKLLHIRRIIHSLFCQELTDKDTSLLFTFSWCIILCCCQAKLSWLVVCTPFHWITSCITNQLYTVETCGHEWNSLDKFFILKDILIVVAWCLLLWTLHRKVWVWPVARVVIMGKTCPFILHLLSQDTRKLPQRRYFKWKSQTEPISNPIRRISCIPSCFILQ